MVRLTFFNLKRKRNRFSFQSNDDLCRLSFLKICNWEDDSGKTVEKEAPDTCLLSSITVVLAEYVSWDYFGTLEFLAGLQLPKEGLAPKWQLISISSNLAQYSSLISCSSAKGGSCACGAGTACRTQDGY